MIRLECFAPASIAAPSHTAFNWRSGSVIRRTRRLTEAITFPRQL
jgi:hypothetical protein